MNLKAINKDLITAADFANAFNLKEGFAKKLLDNSTIFWTYKKYYIFRCPDCGAILKKATNLKDILGREIECDGPHEEGSKSFVISRKDISIVYGK